MKKENIIIAATAIVTAALVFALYKAGIIFDNSHTPISEAAPRIAKAAENLGELCTASFYDEVLVQTSQETTRPPRELTAIMKITCRAVYDMEAMAGGERMTTNGDTLFIELPKARLRTSTPSLTDIDIIAESGTWDNADDLNSAIMHAMRQAERHAVEDDIYGKADKAAREMLSKIFSQMGLTVTIYPATEQ